MADETTDTTATETSTTETSTETTQAADTGGTDATEGSDAVVEGDGSLVGNAGKTPSGDGDSEGDGKASGEGDGDDPAKAAAEGPPETYELKVQTKDEEGKDVDVEIDTELLAEATPIFKEVGLTNEQANKLAPLALKVQERFVAQQTDAHETMKADWAKQTMADPEIGGKNWKETEAHIAKAFDTFNVPDDFRQLLNDTGLGNHPVMARVWREIGEKVGEGGEFIRGDKGAQQKVPREAVLYPDDVPKAVKA